MKVQKMKLNEIYPYYNNPRDNSNAVAPVMESFKKFGFIKPILVDKEKIIIAGHTRYIASFQLGLEYVPVIVSDMPEEQAKRYRILDNKIGEKSYFDDQKLLDELRSMNAPKEMQAFFFEDIDMMLNFSFESLQEQADNSGGFDYNSNIHEEYADEQSYDDESVQQHEESEESDDPADGLFVLKTQSDGTRTMKVVCPFCGNIEEITIN